MSLHVGLNMLHLVPGETGGSELYARHLVPALLEAGGATLTLLAPSAAVPSLLAEPWGRDVELVGIPVEARSRVRRALAEQTRLRRPGIDLLHNLFTTAPAFPAVPQVTTILDVIYKRFPETHAGLRARGLALLTWISARRSRRIIAISEAAKSDIVQFLGVPSERVDVTYPGPALPLGELDPASVRASLDLGEAPIVLTVSGRIRFTGWLEDEVLDALFWASTCFVFPSLAEGFGLPVLDALARGVPVATSNASSLPEVGGDAVIYFDPTNTGAMTNAITSLLENEELRKRLRAAGPSRAAEFSWSQTAEATLASYRRTLAS